MHLNQWIVSKTGIPGYHSWWCYQFDSAVRHFGQWIENEYEKRDKRGNRINKLDHLLSQKRINPDFDEATAFFKSFGSGISIEKG